MLEPVKLANGGLHCKVQQSRFRFYGIYRRRGWKKRGRRKKNTTTLEHSGKEEKPPKANGRKHRSH